MGRSSKTVGALTLADGEARALRERVFAGDEAAAGLRELDAHAHADSREARFRYRRDREKLVTIVQAGEDAAMRMVDSVRAFAYKTAGRLIIPSFCRHLVSVDDLAYRGLLAALDAVRKWEPGRGLWFPYACGRVHAYMLVELKAAIAGALGVPVLSAFDYVRAVSAVNGGVPLGEAAAGLGVDAGVLAGVLGRARGCVDVDSEASVLAAGGSVADDGGVDGAWMRAVSADVLGFSGVEWEAVCSLAAGEPASMSAVGRSRASVLRGLRDRGMIA